MQPQDLALTLHWYEWKANGKQKQPFFFRLKEEAPMLFAGLWETWDDEEGPVETCAILTTDANDLTKEIHNRMPVLLAGADALAWIEPGDAKEKLKELLRPFAPDKLTFHAVDPMVGNVRTNSPDCIKPA
jgi:putative SOS response-associated peptidase YedK